MNAILTIRQRHRADNTPRGTKLRHRRKRHREEPASIRIPTRRLPDRVVFAQQASAFQHEARDLRALRAEELLCIGRRAVPPGITAQPHAVQQRRLVRCSHDLLRLLVGCLDRPHR